ncbi:unnamed protein product [Didymodactylos carnosus]|uniref:Uncharacterized protein n=1 Tax=Didymodactylos carnosus TaxID=1234261 RepID=A0A816CR85_9BILA|nr:unnamed protein product [Didymodactylos carnosus]CAF1625926.1 unnamed protein product [Didymodactylos carnosus]CAF4334777.1 unnamed protein product [Didymodactylos carnosus]CAF4519801.1 unnamed protein product [Didymodactylos carnosus]
MSAKLQQNRRSEQIHLTELGDISSSIGNRPVATHRTRRTVKPDSRKFTICGLATLSSICVLVILGIVSALPCTMLALGIKYRDECPIEHKIPLYLIVHGSIALIHIVLGISMFFTVLASNIIRYIQHLISQTLSLFIFIWLIIGSVWLFSVKSKVQYNQKIIYNIYEGNSWWMANSRYCNETLYKFTMAMLILGFISNALACCSSCMRFRSST